MELDRWPLCERLAWKEPHESRVFRFSLMRAFFHRGQSEDDSNSDGPRECDAGVKEAIVVGGKHDHMANKGRDGDCS